MVVSIPFNDKRDLVNSTIPTIYIIPINKKNILSGLLCLLNFFIKLFLVFLFVIKYPLYSSLLV